MGRDRGRAHLSDPLERGLRRESAGAGEMIREEQSRPVIARDAVDEDAAPSLKFALENRMDLWNQVEA